MPGPQTDYIEAAHEMAQEGNIEGAQVLSMLAIAQAINNLADELRGMGTPGHPVHVFSD